MSAVGMTEVKQYLTFMLDREIFALEVGKVLEILDSPALTKIPRTPDFMRGVINLRGRVVPVVDLRLRFGMERAPETAGTCIVVMEIEIDGEGTVLGALVDSVREVIDLEQGHIEPPPRIGTRLRTDFIRGMGRRDEDFLIILDIDRVFSQDELEMVRDVGVEAAA